LVGGEADSMEDVAENARRHVATAVNRDVGEATVGMP
jgi:hypothetical protein